MMHKPHPRPELKSYVTPQVVDKFVLLALTTNKRHPERSEGPPEFG
ncbi:MAG: hypothetical protein NTW08_04175 [Gammaproteobacteria bacterium]|nr:hypothetical protein [Gammaproteobacteria bacterium]